MKVLLGADHGGFRMKEQLRDWLRSLGHEVVDVGNAEFDPDDDYPQFATSVAHEIQSAKDPLEEDPSVFGILICRSGGGMCIVANRFGGVRAVVCRSLADAKYSRTDNNANVVCLEGDHLDLGTAQEVITAFMETPFEGGRHARRLNQFRHLG